MTAASNEKSAEVVPGMPLMVTIENGFVTAATGLRHTSEEPDVQPAVRQSTNPMNTEAVADVTPKLSPLMVSDAKPHVGIFLIASEIDGESNVKA